MATVNASNLPKIKKYAKKHRMKLYEIGYVTKGKGVFHKKNGKLIKIKDGGWATVNLCIQLYRFKDQKIFAKNPFTE